MNPPAAPPADAPPAPSRSRQRVVRAVQVLFAAGVVAYLIRSGQLDLRALAAVTDRWPWWVAAVLTMGGSLAAATLRWHLLLRFHCIEVSLRETVELVLIGFCFNQVTPGSTGGDIAKAIALVSGRRERRTAALFSIAADRLIGVVSLGLIACITALLALPTVRAEPALALFASAAAASLVALGTALLALRALPLQRVALWRRALERARRVGWIDELARVIESHSRRPAHLLGPLAASLVSQTLLTLTVLLVTRALLGPGLELRALAAVVPMALLASGIPVTPFGNAGVLEALYAELLAYASIDQGALVGLLLRSVFWVWALVGAAALVFQRIGSREPVLSSQEEA